MTYISIVCAIVITFILHHSITHEQYKLTLTTTHTGHEEEISAIYIYTHTHTHTICAANVRMYSTTKIDYSNRCNNANEMMDIPHLE